MDLYSDIPINIDMIENRNMNRNMNINSYFNTGEKVGWIGSQDKSSSFIVLNQINERDWNSLFLVTPSENFKLPSGTIDMSKNFTVPLKELYNIKKLE
jgi:hypothetical protein